MFVRGERLPKKFGRVRMKRQVFMTGCGKRARNELKGVLERERRRWEVELERATAPERKESRMMFKRVVVRMVEDLVTERRRMQAEFDPERGRLEQQFDKEQLEFRRQMEDMRSEWESTESDLETRTKMANDSNWKMWKERESLYDKWLRTLSIEERFEENRKQMVKIGILEPHSSDEVEEEEEDGPINELGYVEYNEERERQCLAFMEHIKSSEIFKIAGNDVQRLLQNDCLELHRFPFLNEDEFVTCLKSYRIHLKALDRNNLYNEFMKYLVKGDYIKISTCAKVLLGILENGNPFPTLHENDMLKGFSEYIGWFMSGGFPDRLSAENYEDFKAEQLNFYEDRRKHAHKSMLGDWSCNSVLPERKYFI